MNEVALFTRAWIEMTKRTAKHGFDNVALFTRAWIEIPKSRAKKFVPAVALFTRAWIEIEWLTFNQPHPKSPSSRGRGLKYKGAV